MLFSQTLLFFLSGYDSEKIEQNSLPHNIRDCRVVGKVYRLPILEAGKRGMRGQRKEDEEETQYKRPKKADADGSSSDSSSGSSSSGKKKKKKGKKSKKDKKEKKEAKKEKERKAKEKALEKERQTQQKADQKHNNDCVKYAQDAQKKVLEVREEFDQLRRTNAVAHLSTPMQEAFHQAHQETPIN